MRKLYFAASIGIVLALISAMAYSILISSTPVDTPSPYATILLEAFKILLSFSLITTGGVVIKGLVDQLLSDERDRRIQATRYEETRQSILEEFADIYSDFYSIRKLYHSARSSRNNIYQIDSEEYKKLVRDILQRSVDLEGRYGALKVLAITHFNLPRGEFRKKEIPELKQQISKSEDKEKEARLRLDLLGEYYDDWRHALEQNRKIDVNDEFFLEYERLLAYFEKAD